MGGGAGGGAFTGMRRSAATAEPAASRVIAVTWATSFLISNPRDLCVRGQRVRIFPRHRTRLAHAHVCTPIYTRWLCPRSHSQRVKSCKIVQNQRYSRRGRLLTEL